MVLIISLSSLFAHQDYVSIPKLAWHKFQLAILSFEPLFGKGMPRTIAFALSSALLVKFPS